MLENTAQAQVSDFCTIRIASCGAGAGLAFVHGGAEPAEHDRMSPWFVTPQAEALGILGVNLIHSALTKGGDHYAIVSSLMDDLSRARVEVRQSTSRSALTQDTLHII